MMWANTVCSRTPFLNLEIKAFIVLTVFPDKVYRERGSKSDQGRKDIPVYLANKGVKCFP